MILKYLGKRGWILVAISAVFMFIHCYLNLEIPGYMSAITKVLEDGGSRDEVTRYGRAMIYCALGSLIFSLLLAWTSSRVAASMSTTLRKELFEKVSTFSISEIDHFSTASLINRFTNDISQIQRMIVMGINALTEAPIIATLALIKISAGSWQWFAVTTITVVFMLIVFAIVMHYVIPRFRKIQALSDDVNRVAEENITGVRIVRAFNAEAYQENRSNKADEVLTSNNLSARHAMSVMTPFVDSMMDMLTLSIYWIGAILIVNAAVIDRLDIFSNMVVFSSYALHIIFSFVFLIMTLIQLPRSLVSSKRVQEVLDTEPSIKSGSLVKDLRYEGGSIEMKNVSFRYDDSSDYVLKDISFSVDSGETLAIIGATGSGKTTLINLILRFYDASEGSITIDGSDIKEYDLENLRRKFGYASQKPVIFAGTVDFNVGYGLPPEVDREKEVRRALDIAQASSFVDKLEGGVQYKLSQGGTNLSGGQRQRISIARAVCRKSEILLFDDSFSALDYRTDRDLRDSLRKECSNTTKVIVAQRVTSIMNADKILVIDEGRVVGLGKHDDLLKNCEVYREIAQSQLSEEELMQ